MPQQSDLNELLLQIESIKTNEALVPYIPVGIYVQEAEDLLYWVSKDKTDFANIDFKMQYIDTLAARAGALSQAQSTWTGTKKSIKEAQVAWNEESPIAIKLHAKLMNAFRYAYRKVDDAKNTLELIAEGSGNADMIQDLNDLSVLGKTKPVPLQEIKFDLSLLETAAKTSDKMRQLRAAANGENKEFKEDKVLRDKAYTYLKEAVDEIRDCGKYLFANNPERLKGYRSEYIRQNNNKN